MAVAAMITNIEDFRRKKIEMEGGDPDSHVVPPLTLAQWSERSLTEPDFLMGKWLSTTSRAGAA
jgi:hypothetical protein